MKLFIRGATKLATWLAYGTAVALLLYGMGFYLYTGQNITKEQIEAVVPWIFGFCGAKILLDIFFKDQVQAKRK